MTDQREERYTKEGNPAAGRETSGAAWREAEGAAGRRGERALLLMLCLLLLFPFGYFTPAAHADTPAAQTQPADSVPEGKSVYVEGMVAIPVKEDAQAEPVDTIPPTEVWADDYAYDENGKIPFDPSPTRAVWLSVLCPGLGQIYNRRYWKLPIVIGGFMGLGYATNWNNDQYQDYQQGYRDLMDNDPDTKSYMDFFAPTVKEENLDRSWLERVFKSRKDQARRNRDLCIIGLVALYALCILDAYVDASLTHFSVTPDLSLDWSPTLIAEPGRSRKPAIGLNWALTF